MKDNNVDKSNWFQNITLVLADGRECVYTGKGQIDPTEDIRVVEIQMTRPAPLPEGSFWKEPLTQPADEEEKPDE